MRFPHALVLCSGIAMVLALSFDPPDVEAQAPAGDARTIYRCDSAGATVLSDKPCTGTQQSTTLVDPGTPSNADVNAAAQRAARDKEKLAQLQAQRLAREQVQFEIDRQSALRAASRRKACIKLLRRIEQIEHADAVRFGPGVPVNDPRLARARERYQLQCTPP
jgi:hypothetical protein